MKKPVQKLLFAFLTLLMAVACGKKNGGNSAPAVTTCAMGQPVPGGQMCVNGQITGIPGGMGNLANNVQAQSSYLSGVLNFAATGTAYTMGMDPETLIHTYFGPVVVTGSMNVLNQSLCGAPMGSYMVQGSGMIQKGVLSNLTLTLSGPAQLQIMVYQAFITNPNGVRTNAPGNRLGIYQAQLSVNGSPCGTVATY